MSQSDDVMIMLIGSWQYKYVDEWVLRLRSKGVFNIRVGYILLSQESFPPTLANKDIIVFNARDPQLDDFKLEEFVLRAIPSVFKASNQASVFVASDLVVPFQSNNIIDITSEISRLMKEAIDSFEAYNLDIAAQLSVILAEHIRNKYHSCFIALRMFSYLPLVQRRPSLIWLQSCTWQICRHLQ